MDLLVYSKIISLLYTFIKLLIFPKYLFHIFFFVQKNFKTYSYMYNLYVKLQVVLYVYIRGQNFEKVLKIENERLKCIVIGGLPQY